MCVLSEGVHEHVAVQQAAGAAGTAGAVGKEGKAREDKIKSGDYRSWDQYNVEKECEKVDQEETQASVGEQSKTSVPARLSESGAGPAHEGKGVGSCEHVLCSELSLSGSEKERAAVREKEKGNEVSVIMCLGGGVVM